MNSEFLSRAIIFGEVITAVSFFFVLTKAFKRDDLKQAEEELLEEETTEEPPENETASITQEEPEFKKTLDALRAKDEEFDKFRAHTQAIETALKRKTDDLQSKDQELEKLRQEVKAIESQLKDKNSSLIALEKDNKELSAQLKDAHAKKLGAAEIEKELNVLREQLQSKDQELEKLRQEVEILESELGRKGDSLLSLEKENKELTAELKNLLELRKSEPKRSAKEEESARQEINKLQTENKKIEIELKKKNQTILDLGKENKNLSSKVEKLENKIDELNEEIEARTNLIASYKSKMKAPSADTAGEESEETRRRLEVIRKQKKEKIGEILLANNYITQDILDKARRYQKEYGGNLTQFLLAYGYIDEYQLAQCLCTQFAVPYLPLSSYKIPAEVIKLVPVDIAEKYWLIPVDKVGNLLTIVMADPLDSKAIKEVEEITGCTAQPFLGILSEIIDAFEAYYKKIPAKIKEKELLPQKAKAAPFFVDTETYKGPERREAVRYKAEIDISFPLEGDYIRSKTTSVSRSGFLFESDRPLVIGSLITVQMEMPKEYSSLPIAVVAQVTRIVRLKDDKYGVGVKIIKISKQELNTIIDFASTKKRE